MQEILAGTPLGTNDDNALALKLSQQSFLFVIQHGAQEIIELLQRVDEATNYAEQHSALRHLAAHVLGETAAAQLQNCVGVEYTPDDQELKQGCAGSNY